MGRNGCYFTARTGSTKQSTEIARRKWIEEDILQRNVLHWSPPGTGRREGLDYTKRITEEGDRDSRFWMANANRRIN